MLLSAGHLLGKASKLSRFKQLEQFAVDARRAPKLVLRAHLPDQRAQFHLDPRAPSPRVRFPTPIATKAGPMPPHQRFRLDNRNDLQDRWKPSIHLDEEPVVVVGELGSAPHLAPQDDQLMSEHRILRLKPALRLERRGHNGQNKADQRNHQPNLADSRATNPDRIFGTHTERIRVVLDNLSTHSAGALYQTFSACEARRVLRRLEVHFVPKHASWLNMANFERHLWSANSTSRLPSPKQTKTGTMPTDHRLRRHKSIQYPRSQPIQACKYQTVNDREGRLLRRYTPQHVELVTKRQNLSFQRHARMEQSNQRQPDQAADTSHKASIPRFDLTCQPNWVSDKDTLRKPVTGIAFCCACAAGGNMQPRCRET